jgi:Tfp pilus assembly protein PilV
VPREVRKLSDDGGFTLIETVIALGIAMIVFAALGVVSLAGLRTSTVSRQNQQATDVLNRAVEQARAMAYGSLSMTTSDLAVGDAGSITGTPASYLVPGGIGSEPVVAGAVGGISPHVATVSPDGTTNFVLKRYVTKPSGATVDSGGFLSAVRFTAVVTWSAYGRSHTRRAATILTDTRRGLPLPSYTLTALAPTSQTKAPDTDLVWGLRVRNLGARDAFNIQPSAGTWTFYADTNNNGTLDRTVPAAAGDDQPLGNWDAVSGNLSPDTGQLEPNTTFFLFAYRHIGSSESGDSVVTFTTTSAAQPTAAGAVKSAVVNLSVQSGPVASPPPGPSVTCPALPTGAVAAAGTTLTAFYPTNRPTGNTATTAGNPLARADCTLQSTDHDYSTEDPGHSAGRVIYPGGTAGNVANNMAAEFRYQAPVTTAVNGTAAFQFSFRCTGPTGPVTSGSVTFQTMLGTRTNDPSNLNGFSSLASSTTSSLACPSSGWSVVTMTVPVNITVTQSKYLALRLVTSAGSSPVLVNYDSSSTPSVIVLPVAP